MTPEEVVALGYTVTPVRNGYRVAGFGIDSYFDDLTTFADSAAQAERMRFFNDGPAPPTPQQVQAAANAAAIRASLQAAAANALALADALDANTATPAQQRAALALCLRGIVRLAKVAYSDFAQAA